MICARSRLSLTAQIAHVTVLSYTNLICAICAPKDSRLSSETVAATPIRKTALNAVHRQMGAKMVDFNGWDMPVEYPPVGGLMKEHLAVRNGVGVFDVSHMGDIRISGPQSLAAVQHITMNDAAGMGDRPVPVFGHALSARDVRR